MKNFFNKIWIFIVKYTPFVLKKVSVWYLKRLGYRVYEPEK